MEDFWKSVQTIQAERIGQNCWEQRRSFFSVR